MQQVSYVWSLIQQIDNYHFASLLVQKIILMGSLHTHQDFRDAERNRQIDLKADAHIWLQAPNVLRLLYRGN